MIRLPKRCVAARLAVAAVLLGTAACDSDDAPADASTEDAGLVDCPEDGGTAKDSATPRDSASAPEEDSAVAPDADVDADIEETDGEAGCVIEEGPVTFSAAELSVLRTLGPLPAVPADPTNRVADVAAAATLGQRLYFDPSFSGPLQVASDLGAVGQAGKVACSSCHSSPALDDARSVPDNVSLGTNFHTRNAPQLVNASFYKWTNWGGRFSAQWELPLAVLENPIIMNGNRLQLAHRIFDVYRAEYEAVFATTLDAGLAADNARFPASGKPKPVTDPVTADGPWELMTAEDRLVVNTILVNYSKAIAAYMRLLVSRDAKLDQWLAGSTDALSESARRGAKLFIGKARCVSCHTGSHLSDDEFHNIGVAQAGEHVPPSDDGRFKDVPALLSSAFNSAGTFSDDRATGRLAGLTSPMPAETKSAFRTPGLRNVALTAPYMHAGQLATLDDVIGFYNAGGGTPTSGTKDGALLPLGLDDGERSDLKAFLESLTGAPVPAALNEDTSR